MEKLYTAFVSSVYKSLVDERDCVIKNLLDHSTFPICMEHFVVLKQEDMLQKIGKSDFVVLLIGRKYGSTPSDCDLSYTELEYDFARQTDKPILILDLTNLKQNGEDDVIEEKQQAFLQKIRSDKKRIIIYTVEEPAESTIKSEISRFFTGYKSQLVGWVRDDEEEQNELREKQLLEKNPWMMLPSLCYHTHYDVEKGYLRVGTISRRGVEFDGEGWEIVVQGENFKAKPIKTKNGVEIELEESNSTHWTAHYYIDTNGDFVHTRCIYSAVKNLTEKHGKVKIEAGERMGFHKFQFTHGAGDKIVAGTFHDAVGQNTTGKTGNIAIFKSAEGRDEFVKKMFKK